MAVDTQEQQSLRYVADEGAPRYLTSYIARRAYKEEVQHPPEVRGVRDVIDIHCHAHDGQQDALDLAKHASASGMGGLLYKSIVGRQRPAEAVRKLLDELHRWCDQNGGGPPMWWDPDADPNAHTGPLPWSDAVTKGHYLLDEHGRLKEGIREIFRMVADRGVAVSFAHATHPEIFAMAEEVDRLGIKRAFVDHPFSPFVDLTLEEMRQLTSLGIYMNFTFDEISPLL